jgi:hypothetical protein
MRGAGIRSLVEPFLDTTSDFAEIVFCDPWRRRQAGTPPHPRPHRTGPRRRQGQGVKFGRKLTPHQQKEAIRRRDVDGETLRSIARSYNVSPQTISRLTR